jgi:alkylation response protein AidB-like acyl-CoA dehydrogenase
MIDFGLSDEQKELKTLAQDFAKERLRPLNRDAEKSGVPESLQKEAFEVGFTRMALPEALDGLNLGYLDQAIVLGELAWGDVGITPMLMGAGFAALALKELASGPQLEKFLSPFANQQNFAGLGALGNSEPKVGFDLKALALSEEDGRLYGMKGLVWPCPASLYVVVGNESAWVLQDPPQTLPSKTLVGLLATPAGWIKLEGEKAERLEGENRIDRVVAGVRTLLGAMLLGVSRASLEYALEYTSQRTAFDQTIAQFQGISFPAAEMHMENDGAYLLTLKAAWALDQDLPEAERLASSALAAASKAALFSTDWAVQMLGGHGYTFDYPVEKWMRDARALVTLAHKEEAWVQLSENIIS